VSNEERVVICKNRRADRDKPTAGRCLPISVAQAEEEERDRAQHRGVARRGGCRLMAKPRLSICRDDTTRSLARALLRARSFHASNERGIIICGSRRSEKRERSER